MNRTKRVIWTWTISLLAVLACGNTVAQVLEEIVVTAQKREQNLQDVGISITAFSGDSLSRLGFTGAHEVSAQTPAVQFVQPNGPSSFILSIRGGTQNDFGDHQESPAAVYVDGTYVSQMSGLAFQLFDLERVEILRGPQGTLYGRNATSGLAHFVSKRPTEEFEGYLRATVGEYSQVKLEGAASGPLSDTASGRISVITNDHDAVYTNRLGEDLHNENYNAIRGQLAFDFNEDTSLLLIARASDQNIRAGAWAHRATFQGITVGDDEDPYGTCNGCDALGFREPDNDPFTLGVNISESYSPAQPLVSLGTAKLRGKFVDVLLNFGEGVVRP